MEIPVYIDDKQEGTLTIGREGALTVMEARMRDVGRLVRLSVFGEREAYLGIPVPEGGQMRLVRRLTPGDMRAFPAHPAYAAEKRRDNAPRPAREPAERPAEAEPSEGRHVLWFGGKPHYF